MAGGGANRRGGAPERYHASASPPAGNATSRGWSAGLSGFARTAPKVGVDTECLTYGWDEGYPLKVFTASM